MSTRIGNSRIEVADGMPPVYHAPHRFEWWPDTGHAEVTDEHATVLRTWDDTELEADSARSWRLFSRLGDHRWLATITIAGCCGAGVGPPPE